MRTRTRLSAIHRTRLEISKATKGRKRVRDLYRQYVDLMCEQLRYEIRQDRKR